MSRTRPPIPADIAARALFDSHRTCCVCRDARKPVQIHHIDGDPANNDPSNLAVLCLECHNDTQLKGGFGRKLDADQVIIYRDDWCVLVSRRRQIDLGRPLVEGPPSLSTVIDPELITSLAEIHRESMNWWELAFLYHRIGNDQLRDKYFDRVLEDDSSDETLIRARLIQGRLREVPPEVIDRYLSELRAEEDVDWTTLFYHLTELDRPIEATRALVRILEESLDDDRPFTVAFYLKAAYLEGLVDALFRHSLRQAQAQDELWWQVRPLQELGWTEALHELLESNAERIEAEGPPHLQQLLAEYRGDMETVRALEIEEARREATANADAEPPDEAEPPEHEPSAT